MDHGSKHQEGTVMYTLGTLVTIAGAGWTLLYDRPPINDDWEFGARLNHRSGTMLVISEDVYTTRGKMVMVFVPALNVVGWIASDCLEML